MPTLHLLCKNAVYFHFSCIFELFYRLLFIIISLSTYLSNCKFAVNQSKNLFCAQFSLFAIHFAVVVSSIANVIWFRSQFRFPIFECQLISAIRTENASDKSLNGFLSVLLFHTFHQTHVLFIFNVAMNLSPS